MYCNNCGMNNNDSDKYCDTCGILLIAQDSSKSIDQTNDSSPFGIDYESHKKSFTQFDTKQGMQPIEFAAQQRTAYNPYKASANHQNRKGWSMFIFVSTLIMGIIFFFIWMSNVYSMYKLFDIAVPDTVSNTKLPSIFNLYLAMSILCTIYLAVWFGMSYTISILSRKLQRDNIVGVDIQRRMRLANVVYRLYLVLLVSVIVGALVSVIGVYAEYNLYQQLLEQGWTSSQVGEAFFVDDYFFKNSIVIFYFLELLISVTVFSLVLFGLIKIKRIKKFLKQE